MDRWACLNVRAFPLQLLVVHHPDWRDEPAVVVDRDAPTGLVVWMNRRAERSGIRIGMRYAAALGLCAELQAGVVPEEMIGTGVESVMKVLRTYTPDAEPSEDTPGVFWLDAGGLNSLYHDERTWAERVVASLLEAGFVASLCVGFTRFGTYAVSTTRREIVVFDSPEDETRAAHGVELPRLDLPQKAVETLDLLGVRTVGEFLQLPPTGLRRRFGEETATLHRRASGDVWSPLQAQYAEPPLFEQVELDDPESDHTRLLALITRMLKPLLGRLLKKGEVCDEVRWSFSLDSREHFRDGIKPGSPTSDLEQLADLIRLRLESTELTAGVMTVIVVVNAAPAESGQQTLFSNRTRRDLGAANRALARLRAEFGSDAVVIAQLRDGHLPEARYSLEPVRTLRLPLLRDDDAPAAETWPLVRRVYDRPQPVAFDEVRALTDVAGPHVLSGGWWLGDADYAGVHREYHFGLNTRGQLIWLYYDVPRERWYVQGEVG